MRICILKATNEILEMQSDAKVGTLLKNALNQGYKETDIEEREVNSIDYAAVLDKDPTVIADKEAQLLQYQTQQKKETYIANNLPSWDIVVSAVDKLSSLEEVKVYLKNLSRVIYWLAKNSEV